MNKMDFIPIACPTIGEEEADAVARQIRSGWISMGKKVQELEADICAYTGAKHAITMSNGTATLHAALLAMDVGPGDEVVVPTLSYISSANAVIYCGAKPVFCEADPATFNSTAEMIEAAITEKTKAVMPVDLKGQPADFDAINAMAARKGVAVLADSAESFGAIYKGTKVGTQSAAHSFSFFANKNLTMGEGGCITTNDDAIAEHCRVIRNQGQSERYVHTHIGHNYRLTDISAAFGIEQLKRVEKIMTLKSKVAAYYSEALSGEVLITIPEVPGFCDRPSWYMYCLMLDPSVDRDKVVALMAEQNVDSRLSFPPIHLQPVYREQFGYKEGDFPVSEAIYDQFIDIPCFADMSRAQMERVAEVVKASIQAAQR